MSSLYFGAVAVAATFALVKSIVFPINCEFPRCAYSGARPCRSVI